MLEHQEKGAGGEIQITDSMRTLMREDGFKGLRFEGTTHDCGSKIGFLSANLAYGLDHPEVGAELRQTVSALMT